MKAIVEGTTVEVGDSVGFKSDIEQGGEIVKISTDFYGKKVLTLKAGDGGFSGDYIGGNEFTEERAEDCWVD